MRLQCVGGTAAGGQQVGQLFAGIGEGRSGIGAVLARRPGQCAADAPHPHLFFGVAQPGDSSLGLSAGVLRLGPCGLTTAGDGAQGFLIQFVFGTHSVSL